jgi:cytidylate kinase
VSGRDLDPASFVGRRVFDKGDQPAGHEPPGPDRLPSPRHLADLDDAPRRRDLHSATRPGRRDLECLDALARIDQRLDPIALHGRNDTEAGKGLGYPESVHSQDTNPADPARLVVAIDGPGSSGKSSVGAAAAFRVGYRFCDTGLLYRAVTWLALERNVPPSDADALRALAAEVELAEDGAGRLAHILVDGIDRTAEVHTPPVDAAVSAVSAVPQLRAALLERQRALADGGGIVMAGRDIGTVVLPNADLKLFLDASVEERARRRAEERGLDPSGPEAEAILEALRLRDRLDSTRAVAPLHPAADARIIATDGNRFEDTVDAVASAILDAQARRAAEREPTSTR